MKRRILLFLLVSCAFLALPAVAFAQDEPVADDEGVLFKVNGSTSVPAGETIQNAIIINGNIDVAGTIEESLVVLNGNATVSGTVTGDITVVRGDLNLESTAVVDEIMMLDGTLNRADGATVNGDIEDRSYDFSLGRGFAVFSAIFWVGSAVLGLVVAALFAWLGRAQLYESVNTLRTRIVPSIVTALLLWIILPIVAALIVFTVVGAPLGLSILIVLLPILWLLGTVIIGAWIGSYILKPTTTWRTIGSAALGVLIVALVSLIPFVAFIVGLAGLLGSGALVYRAVERARGTPAVAPVAAAA